MPATPVLSNGGTGRGLPISCYLNSVDDSLEGHRRHLERECLAGRARRRHRHLLGQCPRHRRGGRPQRQDQRHHPVRPGDGFSLTLAISQGSLRRGSAACYLDISHPEIEEFLEIRKPSGDFNRKALNLHHGVLVTDAFMEAVRDGAEWMLQSPKDGSERGSVDARSLFQKLVETRLATGEPYIIFIDQVNRSMPKHQRDLGLKVTTSNLCSRDHPADRHATISAHERTAVCCLSSLNLETWDEWNGDKMFIEDVMRFLDNVLQRLYRPRARRRWRGPNTAPSASAASASA